MLTSGCAWRLLPDSFGADYRTARHDAEIRCYMRDPEGCLIEVGQGAGVLTGHLAAERPEDLPG